jgi:hypothetical protein
LRQSGVVKPGEARMRPVMGGEQACLRHSGSVAYSSGLRVAAVQLFGQAR